MGVRVRGLTEGIKAFDLVERGGRGKGRVEGVCFFAGLGENVAKRMRAAARKKLEKYFGKEEEGENSSSSSSSSPVEIDIEVQDDSNNSLGRGGGILLTFHTPLPSIYPSSSPPTIPLLAYSAMAEKGKKAEEVGEDAADGLIEQIEGGGCVDEYMQVC